MTDFEEPGQEDEHEQTKSKSQLKREMHELQAFAASMTQLKAAQLDALDLPEKLRKAIDDYRKISKSHIARKRHTQYLGKLMKGLDSEALARQISRLQEAPVKKENTPDWSTELAETLLQRGEEQINALLLAHPTLERPTLRQYHREHRKASASEQSKICGRLSKYLRSNIER